MSEDTTDWRSINWEDLIKRLMLFTAGRINRLTWRGVKFGDIPGGWQPEDFVYEAIKKTISEERKWNHENDLYHHLVGAILSEINHKAERSENVITVISSRYEENNIVDLEAHRSNPEHESMVKSERKALIAYLESRNPEARRLAEIMLDQGLTGTIEVSNVLGISISQVENLKKSLRRLVSKYLDIQKRESS